MFLRKVTPGSTSRLTIVDHGETYGRHILEKAINGLRIETCVDLGCGGGDDLMVVAEQNPQAVLYGIDFGEWNFEKLKARNIRPSPLTSRRRNFLSTITRSISSLQTSFSNIQKRFSGSTTKSSAA